MILSPLKTYALAGHSNSDPGAVANGRKEADETIKAKALFNKHFEKKHDLINDRDEHSLREVLRTIGPGKGSVLVDFHFDAASPKASGTTFFVNRKDFANKNSMSYRMASEMVYLVSKILGIPNRGVKCESTTRHGRLGVLNIGAGCAALGELGFITNDNDMKTWDAKQDEVMKGLAAIAQKYDDMI